MHFADGLLRGIKVASKRRLEASVRAHQAPADWARGGVRGMACGYADWLTRPWFNREIAP